MATVEPAETDNPWQRAFTIDGSEDQSLPLSQVTATRFVLRSTSITYTSKTGLEELVEPHTHEAICHLTADDLQRTDLASVPGPLRWFSNTYGAFTPAAMFHDWLIPDSPDVQPLIPEEYADRYFRWQLGAVGEPRFKRYIMWTAVALRTRWKSRQPHKRWMLIVWAVLATAGLASFFMAVGDLLWGWGSVVEIDSSVVLILSLLLAAASSALWQEQYAAGIVAAMAAPWLLPAAAITTLGYGIYLLLEKLNTVFVSKLIPEPYQAADQDSFLRSVLETIRSIRNRVASFPSAAGRRSFRKALGIFAIVVFLRAIVELRRADDPMYVTLLVTAAVSCALAYWFDQWLESTGLDIAEHESANTVRVLTAGTFLALGVLVYVSVDRRIRSLTSEPVRGAWFDEALTNQEIETGLVDLVSLIVVPVGISTAVAIILNGSAAAVRAARATNYELLHPDGLAGYRKVGDVLLRTLLFTAVPGIFLLGWLLVLTDTFGYRVVSESLAENYWYWEEYFAPLLGLAALLLVGLGLVPLNRIHRLMRDEAKKVNEDPKPLAIQLLESRRALAESLREDTEDPELQTLQRELAAYEILYQLAKHPPTWPFDRAMFAKAGFLQLPTAISLVQAAAAIFQSNQGAT